MTDSNRQPRTESNRQGDERSGQDELGGYRVAMDVQETTMEQGQQAIRQTAELQRSFAQATLRGIESQRAAQRQAFEFTKAAIGSYVDTMSSMLPAIEEQTGRQSEQPGQQTERTGRRQRQAGRRARRQISQSGQQPPETGRTAGQRSGGQTAQIREHGGEFQRAEAPHERGIRPSSGGQRGGGYQPPQQSGTQSQGSEQPPQTSPSQSGSSGQHGHPQSRPPGATGQSGGPTGYQRSEGTTDRHRTERGQSGFRGPGERDESSDRPDSRTSPTHQQRQEPPRTSPPGDGSSRREIPISSSSGRTRGSSDGNSEHGGRSSTGGESNEEREEPTE